MTINNVIREAAANVIRWHKVCETAQPRDWCVCVPMFGTKGVKSLLYFAPPDVPVEIPQRSAWDAALFCPDCDKPRTPLYVHGLWPAGLRERLTGEQLEEELEVKEIEEEKGKEQEREVVFPFPSNGNGYHQEPKPVRVGRDDDEWGNSDSDDDWAL